jgi:hypothetical protein
MCVCVCVCVCVYVCVCVCIYICTHTHTHTRSHTHARTHVYVYLSHYICALILGHTSQSPLFTPGLTLATSPPSSSYLLYARGSRCSPSPPLGPHLTCFTSTKGRSSRVQTCALYARGSRCACASPPGGVFVLLAQKVRILMLILLTLHLQKYKY